MRNIPKSTQFKAAKHPSGAFEIEKRNVAHVRATVNGENVGFGSGGFVVQPDFDTDLTVFTHDGKVSPVFVPKGLAFKHDRNGATLEVGDSMGIQEDS
jgi:hypothetical protein